MPRIRSIKPEFFTSLTVASCSDQARLTFIGLWTYVDDEGRGVDDARLVRAAVWPLDDRPTSQVEGYLDELEAARLIVRYQSEGRRCFVIRNWKEHQRVDRPSPSKLPPPPELEDSTNNQRGLDEASRASRAPAEQGKEGKGEEQGKEEEPSDAGASAPVPADEPPPEVHAAPPALATIPTHDPQRRVTGAQVLGEWINRQPARPSESELGKQGAAARRLANSHTAAEIGAAFLGIEQLWPHGPPKCEPWDLFDLEKKFPKALAAAANHPEIRRRREDAELDQALSSAGAM